MPPFGTCIALSLVMTNLSRTLRILLTACFLLTLLPAQAGELSAVFNGKSFHVGSQKNWNEKNYGLGFEYQLSTASRWKKLVMVNAFRDSYKKMSYMAGGGLHRNLYTSDSFNSIYVDVGVNVFMMSRKNVNNGRPFPGALPSMTIGNRYMGINLTYLPRIAVEEFTPARDMEKNMKGVVFLQLKVNIRERLGLPERRGGLFGR